MLREFFGLLFPVAHVVAAGDVAVNFLLVVEIAGQRGVQLAQGQVWEALQDLIGAHSHLIVARDGADRRARARDHRDSAENRPVACDVRIRFHFHSFDC